MQARVMSVSKPSSAQSEIAQGSRFAFGKNWSGFLKTVDKNRISIAVRSLKDLMQVQTLAGKTFLDIGSGSGLFSLAARTLGAKVYSFDFDDDSVACTRELKHRYFPDDPDWAIEQGSALDTEYLKSLGEFDVVYSWGVLHHTGNMWQALDNAATLVKPDGMLVVALYNDQGAVSKMWLKVKQIYCANLIGRWLILLLFVPYFFVRAVVVSVVRGQNEFTKYRRHRGMSIVHDWIDWLGGLPFEVASVDEVCKFYEARGFERSNLISTKRLGCNQFVFKLVEIRESSI